jgi:hypothetical protein
MLIDARYEQLTSEAMVLDGGELHLGGEFTYFSPRH